MTKSLKRRTFEKINNRPCYSWSMEFLQIERKLKERKESKRFVLRTQANKLRIDHFKDTQKYKYNTFKSSNGWLRRFIKRRKTKFRKKKSGKLLSENKHVVKYLKLLARIHFQVSQSKEKYYMDNPLWGSFPIEICYNMDQVPLNIVVNHDSTFAKHDNNYIHISAPSNALRKRQFTLHVVVNAGSGYKHQGFVDIFSRVQVKEFLKQSRIYDMQEVKSFPRIMNGWILQ